MARDSDSGQIGHHSSLCCALVSRPEDKYSHCFLSSPLAIRSAQKHQEASRIAPTKQKMPEAKIPTPWIAAEAQSLKARYDVLAQEQKQLLKRQKVLTSEHETRVPSILSLERHIEMTMAQKQAALLKPDHETYQHACDSEGALEWQYYLIVKEDVKGAKEFEQNKELRTGIEVEKSNIMEMLQKCLPFALGGSGCEPDMTFEN